MAKIKFIVDESVDFPVVRHLRIMGFDVVSIGEDFPSLEDTKILKKAYEDNRILLVNDKDFGTLIFKMSMKSRGVILFRLQNQSSHAKIKAIELIISKYGHKLLGNFIVVSEGKVRIRKL